MTGGDRAQREKSWSTRAYEKRKQLHLSQAVAAAHIGITQQALSQFECGRTIPRLTTLECIARAYGTTVEALFPLESRPKPTVDLRVKRGDLPEVLALVDSGREVTVRVRALLAALPPAVFESGACKSLREVLIGTGTGTGELAGPVTVGSSAGAPSSGTWTKGATYLDAENVLYVCTAGGTPGTWVATNETDSGWVTFPAFVNGWKVANSYCQYRKIGSRVTCRGGVYGGTSGHVAVAFPSGFRPTNQVFLPCWNTANATTQYTWVNIKTTGTVYVFASAPTDGVTFDGITFMIN